MQSVRYAAGGRIHEMRMPSVENRLGGSTNKYIVRDKAGTGLFMVYDPGKSGRRTPKASPTD